MLHKPKIFFSMLIYNFICRNNIHTVVYLHSKKIRYHVNFAILISGKMALQMYILNPGAVLDPMLLECLLDIFSIKQIVK